MTKMRVPSARNPQHLHLHDVACPVITVLGSSKHRETIEEAIDALTIEGWLVFAFGGKYLQDAMCQSLKFQLDDMWDQKILLSDAVFVVNVGGYIGESTAREIEVAKRAHKAVYYLEEVRD